MTKFKLGFLKSSASSSDKFFLDNPSESSCGVTPSPKFKRFFTLLRKRNDSQSQSLRDICRRNTSASPPRAINSSTGVTTITSSTSTDPGRQLATLLFHSQPHQQQPPPAQIDASRPTGGSHIFAGHFEMIERVATIGTLDSMEKDNQPCQKNESLSRRSSMEITETQERPDINNGINLPNTMSNYYPPASISSKIADSSPLSSQSHIAKHAHEEHPQIQSADQRYYEVSKLHHILEVQIGRAHV